MSDAGRAATVSLVATTVVVAVKIAGAVASGSVSVLAEGLQSTVDVLVAFAVLQTVRVAALPPDEEHPYGHGKAELLVSALQMVLILATAGFMLSQAVERLRAPTPVAVDWGLAALGYAVASNLVVGRYVSRTADRTGSAALRSEAVHLRGDTLTSLGIFVGLLAVGVTGWPILDPIVAIAFIAVVMLYALRGVGQLVHPLMDGSLPEAERLRIEEALRAHPHVRGYHRLRTRSVGSRRFVELHVTLDDDLTFIEAHDLAEHVEDALRKALGGAEVAVHYEPHAHEEEHQRREHGGLGG